MRIERSAIATGIASSFEDQSVDVKEVKQTLGSVNEKFSKTDENLRRVDSSLKGIR